MFRSFWVTLPALVAVTSSVLFLAARAGAQAPVQLGEQVRLTSGSCSITITGGDLTVCEGLGGSASAVLTCEAGYVSLRPPEWFVDETSIGSGATIAIPALAAGTYSLRASCGSCADSVVLTVLEAADCLVQPDLAAIYADVATENTAGVFQPVNRVGVTPANFSELAYLLRPVTLDAAIPGRAAGGERVAFYCTGSHLQLFRSDGTAVPLPDTLEVATLPITLYLNATGTARERLIAVSLTAELADTILVRSGPFPGLAGDRLAGYPHFQFVRAVNQNDTLQTGLDPARHAERLGLPYRVYVVAAKNAAGWAANNTLTDVSGGFETASVAAGSISSNVVNAWMPSLDAGVLSKDYDVVFDFGLDGRLDPGDLIDGGPSAALLGSGLGDLTSNQEGVAAVIDLTTTGPHAVTETIYSGGAWLDQDLYYPTDIASLGEVPLVMMSHGNGHDETWYDYLGNHLASHGFIFMSHSNNTGPGIETASTTTLTNTDYFLGHLATIAGGVLQGHVQRHNIIWIGHSRGGEGVTRAYDRVADGTYTPAEFVAGDITAISSIAPTVFLATTDCNPHDRPYHLLWGGADGDVSGMGSRPWQISDHADGTVQTTYVHGASHNDFNCCGFADGTGPDLIGRAAAQTLAKGYYLAFVELYAEGNRPLKDYVSRMYHDIHPIGIDSSVVVAMEFWDHPVLGSEMVDDYQANPSLTLSSSGGAVLYSVSNVFEGELADATLAWSPSHPMAAMIKSDGVAPDDSDGGIFDWTTGQQRYYEFEVVPALRDFTDNVFLSFRACQQSQHPETIALAGPLDLTVTLRDGAGITRAINTGSFGQITRPYQRSGGWWNEFNTVRIRLADFQNDGSGIDLTDVRAVRLEFGAGFGSGRGRLGLDRVELTRD